MNLGAVNRFIGTDWSYGDNDCWAVFCKASHAVFGRYVHAVDIPAASDPEANCALFTDEFQRDRWRRVDEPDHGCAVLCRDSKGNAVHVGLYITDGNVLHCPGSVEHGGHTRYDPLATLRRVYGSVEFYQCKR